MSETTPPGEQGDGEPSTVRICVVDALRGLAAAVSARGAEHVDPAAEYLAAPIFAQLRPGAGRGPTRQRYTGTCPCMVGSALDILGVPRQVLAATDLVTGCTRITDLHLSGVELSDAARLVFAAAQDAQDSATTWGHALETAFTAATDAGLLSDDDLADLSPHVAAAVPVPEAAS